MNLRDKYNKAIQTAKDFHMQGSAQERDGKLHFDRHLQREQRSAHRSGQDQARADIEDSGGREKISCEL